MAPVGGCPGPASRPAPTSWPATGTLAEGAVELVPPAPAHPVDPRDLAEDDLRAAVSVVGQEAPLFHGTLAENLRLGAR